VTPAGRVARRVRRWLAVALGTTVALAAVALIYLIVLTRGAIL
jgi:hypothetical protein